MTDEQIAEILETLNQGGSPNIVIAPIGKRVWWGFVYEPIPNGEMPAGKRPEEGFEFFFVQGADDQFAGAVFRMGTEELHWYVTEACRGKGLLVKPLRSVILPFIFKRYDDDTQQGSVQLGRDHAEASMRLAEKAGFQKISEGDNCALYEARRENFPEYKPARPEAPGDDEHAILEREVWVHVRALKLVLEKIRVRYSAQHFEDPILSEASGCILSARSLLVENLDKFVPRRNEL